MDKARAARGGRVIVILLIVAAATAHTSADVVFFIQREGSLTDNGLALFILAAGNPVEQDFEDPAIATVGTPIRTLPVGDFQLGLLGSTPAQPFLGSSPEFNVEGEVFGTALVTSIFLTITPHQDQLVLACGAWIFDDGAALDSAYLLQVTELNGSGWQAVLENEIGQNVHNHEIEGFIGAVSDVGIAELTLTAIDPATGQAQVDSFEIDHLKLAGDPSLSGDDDDGDEDDGEADDDGDDGEDREARRRGHPRHHEGDPHHGDGGSNRSERSRDGHHRHHGDAHHGNH